MMLITGLCAALWITVTTLGVTFVIVTVLLQLLFSSFVSETLLSGSTVQVPSLRGLLSEPPTVAVTLNFAPKVPPFAPITTEPPLAEQVSTLLEMPQLIFAAPVMPLVLTTLTEPYVTPVVGS